jgi:hypothetical protein
MALMTERSWCPDGLGIFDVRGVHDGFDDCDVHDGLDNCDVALKRNGDCDGVPLMAMMINFSVMSVMGLMNVTSMLFLVALMTVHVGHDVRSQCCS